MGGRRLRTTLGIATAALLAAAGPGAIAAAGQVRPLTTVTWHVETSPNTSNANRRDDLFDVACPTATACVAVGDTSDSHYDNPTGLVERWNGSKWSVQATAAIAGNPHTEFDSVACSSPSACTLVGEETTGTGTPTRALVERWNGSKWSVQATPTPASGKGALYGVACVNATSCYAVGDSLAKNGNPPLIEHWNGKTWTIQTVPHPAGVPYSFYTIACRSNTDCTAGGEVDGANGAGTTLMMHWNGSKWSLEATPATPGHSAFINDVRCPSATQCLAAADTYTPVGVNAISDVSGVAEEWNGHTWTMLPTAPLASGTTSDFFAVACPAVSKCVIVGDVEGTGLFAPLAEHWNGSTFTMDTTQADGSFSYFDSVNCNGAACVAVGAFDSTSGLDRTLVERT
jgi:hypothetical protein